MNMKSQGAAPVNVSPEAFSSFNAALEPVKQLVRAPAHTQLATFDSDFYDAAMAPPFDANLWTQHTSNLAAGPANPSTPLHPANISDSVSSLSTVGTVASLEPSPIEYQHQHFAMNPEDMGPMEQLLNLSQESFDAQIGHQLETQLKLSTPDYVSHSYPHLDLSDLPAHMNPELSSDMHSGMPVSSHSLLDSSGYLGQSFMDAPQLQPSAIAETRVPAPPVHDPSVHDSSVHDSFGADSHLHDFSFDPRTSPAPLALKFPDTGSFAPGPKMTLHERRSSPQAGSKTRGLKQSASASSLSTLTRVNTTGSARGVLASAPATALPCASRSSSFKRRVSLFVRSDGRACLESTDIVDGRSLSQRSGDGGSNMARFYSYDNVASLGSGAFSGYSTFGSNTEASTAATSPYADGSAQSEFALVSASRPGRRESLKRTRMDGLTGFSSHGSPNYTDYADTGVGLGLQPPKSAPDSDDEELYLGTGDDAREALRRAMLRRRTKHSDSDSEALLFTVSA